MPRIPEETINQVIDRADIVEIISSSIPLKKAGRNFKAPCPFHQEKTPSFIVNPQKQIFHCFGCGVGGNVLSFVMKQERMEFPEAVRYLAQKYGIHVPEDVQRSDVDRSQYQKVLSVQSLASEFFHRNLIFDKGQEAQKARDYLKARGFDLETVKDFQMGLAYDAWDRLVRHANEKKISLSLLEKAGLATARQKGDGYYDRFRNRIIFPIFDVRGKCLAFGGRALGDDPAKYLNSPETDIYVKGKNLYGLNIAKKEIVEKDAVIVVEGYIDCIMPHRFGIKNVVAALGTALTTDQIRLLKRYTLNVILLFDRDAAGEAAMLRSLKDLVAEGVSVKVARLPQGEDPDSFLNDKGKEAFESILDQAQAGFDYQLNSCIEKYDSKNIEGRSKIVHDMFPLIECFSDEVMRSGYLSFLGQKLSVRDDVIRSEYQNWLAKQRRFSEKQTNTKTTLSDTFRAVEWELLKVMLYHQELFNEISNQINEEMYQDQKAQLIYRLIRQELHQNKTFELAHFLQQIQEEEAIKHLSMNLIQEPQGDVEKIWKDCVRRIKQDDQKLKRQLLKTKIEEAKRQGQKERVEKLEKQLIELY